MGCEEAPVKLDGEAQVSDAAGSVLLDQDVLALQVSVGDGGLPLRAVDFRVQVTEAARRRIRQPQQHLRVQRAQLQVVVERAVLVVVGDEEELREGARALNVRRDEACGMDERQVRSEQPMAPVAVALCPVLHTQNVVVSHQDRLVNLRLSEPAGLFSGEEHLDSDLLASPAAQPHLAVTALTNLTHHLNLLGDGSLHLRGRRGDHV